MRIRGSAIVRNEADVIEAFVRHNLTVLDGIVVVDLRHARRGIVDPLALVLAYAESLIAAGRSA